jgi:hypothetical protein
VTEETPSRDVDPDTAATRRLLADESERVGGRPRRSPLIAAAAGLAVAAIVAAAVFLGGGGGDGDPASAGEGGETTTAKSSGGGGEVKRPQTLTRAQLIAKADAICAGSKDRYTEVRDLESEYSTDIPYSEALVRFARERVRGLRGLRPPARLAGAYREYVKAQERVYATDRQALAAARQGDAAGVEEARARRDSEDELRERLARQIGFAVCSTPQT